MSFSIIDIIIISCKKLKVILIFFFFFFFCYNAFKCDMGSPFDLDGRTYNFFNLEQDRLCCLNFQSLDSEYFHQLSLMGVCNF